MRRFALVIAVLILASAASSAHADLALEDGLEVITVDSLGQPFSVTQVAWYLPPVGGATTEVPGTCVDAECSRWRWNDPPDGSFYVVATWSAPSALELECLWSAYEASPVTRTPGAKRTVRLELHALYLCE